MLTSLTSNYALALVVIFLFVGSHYFAHQLPEDRQKMTFTDSAKAVQDSMVRLRQISASIEPRQFTNCFVHPYDSTVILNRRKLGKLDTLSSANTGFIGLKVGDAHHIIAILKFLRRNRISGVHHEVSMGFWVYGYKYDPHYSGYTTIRQLYIWDLPADTLTPAFQYYTQILDRKQRMVLIGLKDVPYRKF